MSGNLADLRLQERDGFDLGTDVGRVQKNAREVLVVRLTQYMGHDLCDMRLWVLDACGTALAMTPKGVSFARRLLPEVIALLQRAERAATAPNADPFREE
jgi:hypothetical protein